MAIYKLGEICKLEKGKHYPPTKIRKYWNGEYEWLIIKDVVHWIYKAEKTLSKLGIQTIKNYEKCKFKKDSFVITCDGTIGRIGWLMKDFYSSTQLINVESKKEFSNNKYLYYWFRKNSYIFKKYSKGSVIAHLYKKDIKKIKINLPSIQEQQQIIDIIEPIETINLKIKKIKENLDLKLKNLPPIGKIEFSQIGRPVKNNPKNIIQISARIMKKRDYIVEKFESQGTYKTNSFFVKPKTLLINTIRCYLEKFVIIPYEADATGTLAAIKVFPRYEATILKNLLNKDFWENANTLSHGTKMPVLSKKDLKKIRLSTTKEINGLFEFLVLMNRILLVLKKLNNLFVNLLIN